MGLNDPFSTTYQGASEVFNPIGQALQKNVDRTTQQQQEDQDRKRIRQQGQQLMQQFGMFKQDGTPDEQRMATLGVQMGSNGEVTIHPPQKMPTAMEQITDIIGAQKKAKDAGLTDPLKISETAKGTSISTAPSSGGAAGVTPQKDIEDTVKGVFEGNIPPEKLSAYRDVTRVNAEVERKTKDYGMNLPQLSLEYDATKRFVQSANSTTQIRLRQAIDFGTESTKNIIQLSDDLTRGPNPILNRAQLELAKQGVFGQEQQKKATLLDQQIADTIADLGNVYMGGNSPTDEGLKLASKNLQGEWSAPQLKAAAENVQKLLGFRSNAIKSTAPMYGGQYGTKYYPKPTVMDTPQGQAIQAGQQGGGQGVPQEGGMFNGEKVRKVTRIP
jgi:hypothetical protein